MTGTIHLRLEQALMDLNEKNDSSADSSAAGDENMKTEDKSSTSSNDASAAAFVAAAQCQSAEDIKYFFFRCMCLALQCYKFSFKVNTTL